MPRLGLNQAVRKQGQEGYGCEFGASRNASSMKAFQQQVLIRVTRVKVIVRCQTTRLCHCLPPPINRETGGPHPSATFCSVIPIPPEKLFWSDHPGTRHFSIFSRRMLSREA